MGGHSLIDPDLPPTVGTQFAVTRRAMGPVADLVIAGHHVIVTHGNGPQVGFMKLRSDLARDALHEVPLDSLVADTQGSLGYMIQRALRHALAEKGRPGHVASLVTEVVVDPEDPAFVEPTKPIGRFYSGPSAQALIDANGWKMAEEPHRGWRRVVASPPPVDIIQLETIRTLAAHGVTVVCCGGGGIPVAYDETGMLQGLEAVIDKDRTSALLADTLGAGQLCITTAIDAVYLDFGTPRARKLPRLSLSEARALYASGVFPKGSMGPKIEAAIYFLDRGGLAAVICHPADLVAALDGRAGTTIHQDPAP